MSSEAKEIKLELAFPYDINIIPTVNGGCIVNVGCARLSYQTPARMITDLKKYLADPEGYEKAFNECNKLRAADGPERPSLTRRSVGAGQVVEQLETAPDGPMAEQENNLNRREGDSAETGGSPGDDR